MKKNIIKISFLFFVMITFASCQKMKKPALGNYPTDANPPGGALKFYAAFDGTSTDLLRAGVDSIRANFPSANTGSVNTGITGNCYKGSTTGNVKYGKPNDFAASTSFTVALWIKNTPPTSGWGTSFAFSLNSSGYSWTNTKMFLEFEEWSTSTVGNAKFYVNDNWAEYINAGGMPNVFNGNWHHLAFTYDGTATVLKCYIDGSLFNTRTINLGLGTTGFGSVDDFTIGGPNTVTHAANGWMNYWLGSIDQFRLYNTALTSTQVSSLYASKL